MLIIPAYYLFPASLAWVNIFSWFADLICVLCMGKGRESVYCNVLDLLSSLSEQDIWEVQCSPDTSNARRKYLFIIYCLLFVALLLFIIIYNLSFMIIYCTIKAFCQ